ncbi:TatD DNase [Dimargaris xerosporica]|nr:TatD DNase [Dimargaris xerosporica]
MTAVKFVEIGANLTDSVFRGNYRGKQAHPDDFDQVLQRAQSVGVTKIMVTGGSVSESREAIALAKQHSMLFATVGCHPTRCLEFEKHGDPDCYYQDLLQLARAPGNNGKVVAIGECGLDYDRLQFCPKDVQLKYFEKQIELAERTGLPMFLHNRNTGDDFIHILPFPLTTA